MPNQFDGLTLADLDDRAEEIRRASRDVQDQLNEIARQIQPLNDRRSMLMQRLREQTRQIDEIEAETARRKTPRPEPTVTDHALLRYIERVCEIDIEALRRSILTPTVKQAIQSGATAVKTADFLAVVKGNCITTITTPEEHPERKNNKLTRAQRQRLEEDDESVWDMIERDGVG